MQSTAALTDSDRALYEWQISVPGFGEAGQRRLKECTALISRCGGLGGLVAYELAAAGIGGLVLYHGGRIVEGDLNRQLLMTRAGIGTSRIDSVVRRLHDLNPDVTITAVGENISLQNAADAMSQADIVIDCAPLFAERFALNHEAVRRGTPMVEAAMYSLEAHVTTLVPGETPCLRCLYPEDPPAWRRKFPVFGAVSGMAACIAAMEAIKVLTGLGQPLCNTLLSFDASDMSFRKTRIKRRPACPECAGSRAPG